MHRPAIAVEFQDAIAIRIIDPMAEHGGARVAIGSALYELAEAGAVKDIVAEDKRAVLPVDKLLADDEGLGDTVGLRLHPISDVDAPLTALAKERLETRHFRFGCDDEDVANAR